MLTVTRRLESLYARPWNNRCCGQTGSFTRFGDTGAGAAPELQV
jgi:hypothetical protein